MRKLSLLAVVGIAATVALSAPAASAQAPAQQDSVTATGNAILPRGGGFFALEIQARSGPSGETPSGSASFRLGSVDGLLVGGEVTCLRVSGRVATLEFRDATFESITVSLTDNVGTGLSDTMQSEPTIFMGSCSPISSPFFLASFTVGGVDIVDAPPLPVSKEQCKNGGWRNFPGFKNQGACVSFVATGGRNPASGS